METENPVVLVVVLAQLVVEPQAALVHLDKVMPVAILVHMPLLFVAVAVVVLVLLVQPEEMLLVMVVLAALGQMALHTQAVVVAALINPALVLVVQVAEVMVRLPLDLMELPISAVAVVVQVLRIQPEEQVALVL
jgi:hypothetical protein